jgi:monovalent cation/hydrogen antiporter
MPFTAYLLGEIIHASGVLAVVSCGLLMSQLGPRVGRPHARQQTIAFWSLTTYVLNAVLFVLIGIELQAAVRELTGAALARGLVTVAVVATVCIVVRMVWLFATVYLIRLLDRRPSQRERRTTVRARVMQGFAGFRGAVSLAAALAVPSTLATGTDFPDRDLIIFTTAGVIAVTLAQGMAFPAVVRWARLNPDGDVDEERRRAETRAIEAALDALPHKAAELDVDPAVVDAICNELEHQLALIGTNPDDEGRAEVVRHHLRYLDLRRALIAIKRRTMIELRDEDAIDDIVLRQIQAQLDAEELRLTGS